MRTELERLADVIANAPTYPYEAAKVIHAAGYRLVAPVAGDRETAGVEQNIGLEAVKRRDQFEAWLRPQQDRPSLWRTERGYENECTRWAYKAWLATPSSGGGDHAWSGEEGEFMDDDLAADHLAAAAARVHAAEPQALDDEVES